MTNEEFDKRVKGIVDEYAESLQAALGRRRTLEFIIDNLRKAGIPISAAQADAMLYEPTLHFGPGKCQLCGGRGRWRDDICPACNH